MDEIPLRHDQISKAIGTETIGGHFDELLKSDAEVGEFTKFSARRLNQANGTANPIRLLAIYAVDPAKKPYIFRDLPIARFLISESHAKSRFPDDVEVRVTRDTKDRILRLEVRDASNPSRKLAVTKVTAEQITEESLKKVAEAAKPAEIAGGGKLLKQSIGVRTRGGVYKEILPPGSGPTAVKDHFHDICTSQSGQMTCRLPVYEGKRSAIEDCKLFETYAIAGLQPSKGIQYVRVTFGVNDAGKLQLSAGLLEVDKNGNLRRWNGEPRLSKTELRVERLAAFQRRVARGDETRLSEQMSPQKSLLTGKKAALPASLFSSEL